MDDGLHSMTRVPTSVIRAANGVAEIKTLIKENSNRPGSLFLTRVSNNLTRITAVLTGITVPLVCMSIGSIDMTRLTACMTRGTIL